MAQNNDDELIAYFQRHLVPITFTLSNDSLSDTIVIVTFVMSVADNWLLVTAGHSLKYIEKLTTKLGYKIVSCNLIDSMGINAIHKESIPFAYKKANSHYVYDEDSEDGLDYGVILLSNYYRELLEKNGVQPFTEETWKKQPLKVDFHILFGIPMDFVKAKLEAIEFATTMHHVKPLIERPSGFTEVNLPMFYGQIDLPDGMTNLQGLSGGPILAFSRNEQNELRYWLIALQSRGLRESRYIAACPTFFLGQALENIIKSWEEKK